MGTFTNQHGTHIPSMWVIIYSEANVSSGVLADTFIYDSEASAQAEADSYTAERNEYEKDITYTVRRLSIHK